MNGAKTFVEIFNTENGFQNVRFFDCVFDEQVMEKLPITTLIKIPSDAFFDRN